MHKFSQKKSLWYEELPCFMVFVILRMQQTFRTLTVIYRQ